MRLLPAILLLVPCLLAGEEEGIDPGLKAALGGDDYVEPPPNKALDAKGEATTRYFESLDKVRDEYRRNLAKAVEMADEVHVCLLNHKPVENVPDGEDEFYFSIKPYGSYSKILKSKKLEGKEIAECKKASAKLLASPDELSAFCHLPIHGVRFHLKGQLIFETSICWQCNNYYVAYPDDFSGEASWVGIGDDELQKFLNKVMPIPKPEPADASRKPKKSE